MRGRKRKHTVCVQWAVVVSTIVEVRADSAKAAKAEALRLVREDEATAEDAATQAWEAIRDSGPEIVGPAEAADGIWVAWADRRR